MMNITVIALGKLKESYMREFSAEYEKRLRSFCKLNIIEISPEALPENPNEKQIASALDNEAKKISSKIPSGTKIVSLCIEGRQKSSAQLSDFFEKTAVDGFGGVTFIIGSSYGLSEKIKMSSDERISMSKMTFPHQMARIMLLEQIYRAFSIINGSKYHK